MKVVVVYESMFGNTAAIARSIADGLVEISEVQVICVAEKDTRLPRHRSPRRRRSDARMEHVSLQHSKIGARLGQEAEQRPGARTWSRRRHRSSRVVSFARSTAAIGRRL